MTNHVIPRNTIERRPEFADILKTDEDYASPGQADVSNRMNGWFDTLMLQSRIEVAPSTLLLLTIYSGLTCAGMAFVIRENFLAAALAAVIGSLLPLGIVAVIRSRRQRKIMTQLPGMVEELARAAKAGCSIEHCLLTVAEDTPQPLGQELAICVRRLQMGMDLRSALADLPHKTGITSVRILVTTLTVHQETGGDLVIVLERLSRTLRDRLLFEGRVRAATSASRATAIFLIVLPPLILTFFMMRDPTYLDNLLASTWGRSTTAIAILLEVIGTIWILRILKRAQQT